MIAGRLDGRRILAVEDEMLLLMLVEDMLNDAGCEVITASDVTQAISLIETEPFDAAVLDVNLDGQESYPVADALVKRGKPFVFATGYGSRGVSAEYRDHPVVTKPYQQDELIGRLITSLSPDVGGDPSQ